MGSKVSLYSRWASKDEWNRHRNHSIPPQGIPHLIHNRPTILAALISLHGTAAPSSSSSYRASASSLGCGGWAGVVAVPRAPHPSVYSATAQWMCPFMKFRWSSRWIAFIPYQERAKGRRRGGRQSVVIGFFNALENDDDDGDATRQETTGWINAQVDLESVPKPQPWVNINNIV